MTIRHSGGAANAALDNDGLENDQQDIVNNLLPPNGADSIRQAAPAPHPLLQMDWHGEHRDFTCMCSGFSNN